MGVGLYVTGIFPRVGMNRRAPSKDDLFEQMRGVIGAFASDPFDRGWLSFDEEDDAMVVSLFPAAECVRLEWSRKELTASTKTSTLGPGYHAYVVDLLKQVGEKCGVEWDWDEDETGYGRTGDFHQLERLMVKHVRMLGQDILGNEDLSARDPGDDACSLLLNMPLGDPRPVLDVFSVSPTGPLRREWWEQVVAMDDPLEPAKQMMPWWNRERNAQDWLNIGKMLLWSVVKWRPPADQEERAEIDRTLACFEQARRLDPTIQVPQREIDELRELARAEEWDARRPAERGMGFSRGDVRVHLGGGATVRVPGYFLPSFSEEDGTSAYAWGERSVTVTSGELKDRTLTPREVIAATELPMEGAKVVLDIDGEERAVKAVQAEEDGEHIISAVVAGRGTLVRVTVVYEDEADREWALKTVRYVEPPVLEDGEEA